MEKKNYLKEALRTKQGKQLCIILFIATILSIVVCMFFSDTKLVYLALAFSLVAVSCMNQLTTFMTYLRKENENSEIK